MADETVAPEIYVRRSVATKLSWLSMVNLAYGDSQVWPWWQNNSHDWVPIRSVSAFWKTSCLSHSSWIVVASGCKKCVGFTRRPVEHMENQWSSTTILICQVTSSSEPCKLPEECCSTSWVCRPSVWEDSLKLAANSEGNMTCSDLAMMPSLSATSCNCWIYDLYNMIWYDIIWYGMIWYDMIWYDITWYMRSSGRKSRFTLFLHFSLFAEISCSTRSEPTAAESWN